MDMNDEDQLLTTRQVADLLQVSVQYLEMARNDPKRKGPKCVRIGAHCVRYLRSDIREWINSRRHKLNSEAEDAGVPVCKTKKPYRKLETAWLGVE